MGTQSPLPGQPVWWLLGQVLVQSSEVLVGGGQTPRKGRRASAWSGLSWPAVSCSGSRCKKSPFCKLRNYINMCKEELLISSATCTAVGSIHVIAFGYWVSIFLTSKHACTFSYDFIYTSLHNKNTFVSCVDFYLWVVSHRIFRSLPYIFMCDLNLMVNSLLVFFDRVSLWFIFPIEYRIIVVEVQVCSRQFFKNKNGSGFFHQKSSPSYNGGYTV